MGKIERASDDLVNLFRDVKNKQTIPQWLQFEVLCNNKQKELYKIMKMNDIVEVLTNGINFAVVFNEEVFEQLPDDMKELAIVECLSGVFVSENDTVSLEKPNFNTYTRMLEKYGHEPIVVLHESIKSLLDAKKEKENEEKALRNGAKGRKGKKGDD